MTNIEKMDEANYIVGIELGLQEVTISYLDHKALKPVIYDRSGGYGQVSIPTVMQYITDEKEWIIGEHANMNRNVEGTVLVEQLLDRITNREEVIISGEKFSSEKLLFIYIKNILDSFKQLNPHAYISSLAIALPDHLYQDIHDYVQDGLRAFENIELYVVMSSQAISNWLHYMKQPFEGRTLIFNYSYDEFSVSILEKIGNSIQVKFEASQLQISIKEIEKVLLEEFKLLYQQHLKIEQLSDEEDENIQQLFVEQERWLFQKYGKKQSAKIYYSFAYPPFQIVFNYKRMEELIKPIKIILDRFISEYADNLQQVLLIGKGFKMQWPVDIIKEKMNILKFNAYEIVANGCCMIAANKVIKQDEYSFGILQKEYGIILKENEKELFLPLKNYNNLFIVDFEDDDEVELDFVSKVPNKNIVFEQKLALNNVLAVDNKIRINLLLTKVDEATTVKIEYLPM